MACFQLRLKDETGTPADDEHIIRVGERIIPLLQERDVAVLINDRPDLAKALGADGVHIGQTDTPLPAARELLGEDAIIGVTCHDSRHLGMLAGEAGADYVAFGAFHATPTKTPPTMADPALLTWWQEMTELPCVAIGGITPENAAPLIDAGADFIAASSGVWRWKEGQRLAVEHLNRLMDAHAERLRNTPETTPRS